MREPFGGIVLSTAFRLLVPFSIIYGVYILCFGEYSPGGGFQAGALLAVGVLLSRMILGENARFNIDGKTSVVMAGVGTFLYTFVGWVTLFGGGLFLEYDFMPIKMEPMHEMHAMAIFIIEIGVTICVMMTIINLMDSIIKRGDDDGSIE
ncbi:MAG: MnhB domain-containing protein [Phascolarctobacterium sp.]|nr:MnhB domain-containing protein [Phascolarctobacterium sp.]